MNTPAEMETVMDAALVTLDGRCFDYQVWLSWSSWEPWAVTLTLPSTGEPVEWRFAVELLRASMHGPAGLGDVQLTPSCADGRHEVNQVEVCFGTNRPAYLYLDREHLTEVLDDIEAHFLAACEAVRAEMDAELAWLIDDPDGLWTTPGGEER